ncbi:MAG: D-alanyl-D-alanine carboxypeptidase/D-alanyl-D-alanine-endopeptidase [Verrucomicrobiota bacterium]|nr:D-alanyl-D-alanine carboxypeptidase/D-alanyl-D-alanine-endopeptidase [Verrucomicrobiota bacterium]
MIPEAPHPITTLLTEARASTALAGAAIGFCLINAEGEAVLAEDAETAFIPASSLKTLTTATALEILGPDFRFTTELKSAAPIKDGVIQGDLVIIGGGDPMLSVDDLKDWAADLKLRGLVRVAGGIRGDASVFPGSLYGDFWNWGDIGNGYGSGVAGLNLNHNRYILAFRAGAALGSPASILGTEVEIPGVVWNNEVTTAAPDSGDGVVIHGGETTSLIHLRGTVPLGAAKFQVNGAVPDPAGFAVHQFHRALQEVGIQLGAGSPSMASPAHSLLQHSSPPLIEIITSIHASSDNHETECVFRMLGVKAAKPSAEVIREHWKARGLEFIGLRMEDGCGLARADFIRPLDLARLQLLAGQGPQGAAYKASLLSQDGLRWKGGAMSGVRTFTGYVTGKSGTEYCFAFMVNHYTDGKAVSELSKRVMEAMLGL